MEERHCEIGVVAPDPLLKSLFEEVTADATQPFALEEGLVEAGVAVAKDMVARGIGVIISRGETFRMIREARLPCVLLQIPISIHDVISLIKTACIASSEIGVVGFNEIYHTANSIAPFLPVSMKIFRLNKASDIPKVMLDIQASGLKVIAGTPCVVRKCVAMGLNGFALQTKKTTALDILEEAAKIVTLRRNEKKYFHVDEHIFSQILGSETFFLDCNGKLLDSSERSAAIPTLDARLIWAVQNGLPYEGKISIRDSDVRCKLHPIANNGVNRGALLVVESNQRGSKSKKGEGKFPARYSFENIIHKSECMRECVRQAKLYAASDAAICIRGESGTGKEMLAQAVHNASSRHRQPFIAINCGALPEHLLASELFGYSRGAFTGARQQGRTGMLELANGGTVFLDEINEAPATFQVNLLRFLEEFRFFRLGDEEQVSVDVRVICASNVNLENCVRAGTFRKDLFYRIHVLPLFVPPLRERKSCLPLLLEYFILSAAKILPDARPYLAPEALEILADWCWPGNVRELRNLVERMVILSEGKMIDARLAKLCLSPLKAMGAFEGSLHSLSNEHIRRTLEDCSGNKARAARKLGISTTTLWRRLNDLNETGSGP